MNAITFFLPHAVLIPK
jgi:serine/threonine protein kinase